MEDYNEKLKQFSSRLKGEESIVHVQKVQPSKQIDVEIEVQLNVELPKNLVKRMKSKCVEKELKIKDFLAMAIINELDK